MGTPDKIQTLKQLLIDKKNQGRPITSELVLLRKDTELMTYLSNEYLTGNSYQILYHLVRDTKIESCMCGKPKRFVNYNKGYKKTCGGKECMNKSRLDANKKTTWERYGVEHTSKLESTKKKHDETMMSRHGVKHNWSGAMRETGYDTMEKKYGSRHALQNPGSKKKRADTCEDRHGTLNFLHCEKSKETNIKLYGCENPANSEVVIEKIRTTNKRNKMRIAAAKLAAFNISIIEYDSHVQYYDLQCETCNRTFIACGCSLNSKLRSGINPCPFCNPQIPEYTSIKERELLQFVRDNCKCGIMANCRTALPKYELDIYLPEIGTAIEFNGVYWHSELHVNDDYHIEKTKTALAKGIRILHVWEDDWDLHKDIVKSMVLNAIGASEKIYARKCEIRTVKNAVSKKFCDENHLQGGFNSKFSLGMYYNDKMVAVMCFSGLRFSGRETWEITRFCSLLGMSVIGGATKMFKRFVNDMKPDRVISYCDISISPDNTTSVYNMMGFNLISQTPPNPHWVIDGVRKNRLGFIKSKLVSQGFDENKTAVDIMAERGYYRVFDCGSWKFEWNK